MVKKKFPDFPVSRNPLGKLPRIKIGKEISRFLLDILIPYGVNIVRPLNIDSKIIQIFLDILKQPEYNSDMQLLGTKYGDKNG